MTESSMLNGIHGHQEIERVVYGKPAGPALRAEAERLGARHLEKPLDSARLLREVAAAFDGPPPDLPPQLS